MERLIAEVEQQLEDEKNNYISALAYHEKASYGGLNEKQIDRHDVAIRVIRKFRRKYGIFLI